MILTDTGPLVALLDKDDPLRLSDEPFIGMWRGREDMRDSTAWVSSLRRREWGGNL